MIAAMKFLVFLYPLPIVFNSCIAPFNLSALALFAPVSIAFIIITTVLRFV